MNIDYLLSGSQFSYDSGTSGTVTVPSGVVVVEVACHASADGATFTITPNGPNQNGVQGSAIPVPAVGWFGFDFKGRLAGGTVFTFSGTDAYIVTYAKFSAGAAR